MKNNAADLGSKKLHSHWLSDAIGSAWKLARLGIRAPESDTQLASELNALAAPHLAVLVHKRAKCADGDNVWRAELDRFVARVILPQLDEDPALSGISTEQLAARVDAIVFAEQRRLLALESNPLPSTSRFEDTSWAT
jgi:hypothetical protein